jgi:carbohydrate-binding DOMON domain-containing protein
MKMFRLLMFVAACSFVASTAISHTALAGEAEPEVEDAPEIDPSLMVVGLGLPAGLAALLLSLRRRK